MAASRCHAAIDHIRSKLPQPDTDPFDCITPASSKPGLDMLTGDFFDPSGYLSAGQDDFDAQVLSQAFLARTYIKSLEAHARQHPEQRPACA